MAKDKTTEALLKIAQRERDRFGQPLTKLGRQNALKASKLAAERLVNQKKRDKAVNNKRNRK